VSEILPTFVRDLAHLISELTRNFPYGLPPGAKLFSVDAVGMYSNIDTPHGIEVLTTWLTEFSDDLPEGMPIDFIINSLTEVMKNNIFQFGDTAWRQLRGCAMGTSTAVNYAYLYVGLLDIRRLLPHFKDHLPFFRHFIDDGFGICINLPNLPNAWTNFMRCLNNLGTLKWTCDGHTNSLVFLDLEISITRYNRLVHFATYQKPMNLYLYTPPALAHPDKVL
jgi:hypothetical protein